MIVTPLLQLAADKQASDLFFSVGAPINIKINGMVMPVNSQMLDAENIKQIAYEMMTPEQITDFELHMEMNFSFRVPSIGNFRVNVFRQRGSVAIVIRYVRGHVLNVEELHLPLVLKELIMEKRGLVLMVGATGSGKVDHPGCHDPASQRHPDRSHTDHRRSARVHVPSQQIHREPARDRYGYSRLWCSAESARCARHLTC